MSTTQTIEQLQQQLADQPRLLNQVLPQLKSMKEGFDIIEQNLAKSQKADPSDAPFGYDASEARIWHLGSAGAYQHSLEMLNSSSFTQLVDNLEKLLPTTGAPT